MLPGLRFLLLATTMSVSVLVFALGAAALLRATHESFATLPQRRAPPEQVFVKQQYDTSRPVIALLRAEPERDKTDVAAAPTAPSLPDQPPVTAERKTETNKTEPNIAETQSASAVQVAEAPATGTDVSARNTVVALNIPELPMPPMPDVASLQSEIMRSTERKGVEIAAAPAIETTSPAVMDRQQPVALPDGAKSDGSSTQRTAALSDGGTETERLAAEAKKAEASAIRIRNQQAAKRARAAKIAAQRRAAAIRARAAQQKQQIQQPFGLPFGTN